MVFLIIGGGGFIDHKYVWSSYRMIALYNRNEMTKDIGANMVSDKNLFQYQKCFVAIISFNCCIYFNNI